MNPFLAVCVRMILPLLLGTGVVLSCLSVAAEEPETFTGPEVTPFVPGTVSFPESDRFTVTYDLSACLSRSSGTVSPARPIVNWILFDTGPDFWFLDGPQFLTLSGNNLIVYHNAKVQQYISNVLDRFVKSASETRRVSVRLAIMSGPSSWREKSAAILKPWPVTATEVQAWLISRSDATGFITEISSRSDFLDLNAARNSVPCGETFGWVYAAPVRNYVRDVQAAAGAPNGYITDSLSVDEGYRFELTPLYSKGGDELEVMVRCESTVVEKTHSFSLKVVTPNEPRQQLTAETPQVLRCERKAKLSFPADHICVLDLGMVPLRLPDDMQSAYESRGLGRLVGSRSFWYNVLVIVEAVANTTAP